MNTPQQSNNDYTLIWIIPILTLLITGWLIYNDYVNSGIKITLKLNSGSSIIAGKTPVKYLGVEVGKVIDVDIAKDPPHKIDVTVKLRPRAAMLAVEGTKFWLVKPVLSFKKISGLETLVSGHYIAVKPAVSDINKLKKLNKKNSFICLEEPPTKDIREQGTIIDFTAQRKGSIKKDTGIYFKDIKIGHVINFHYSSPEQPIKFSAIIYSNYQDLLEHNYYLTRANLTAITYYHNKLTLDLNNSDILLYGGINFHLLPTEVPTPQTLKLYDSTQQAKEELFKFSHAKKITLYTKNPQKLQNGSPLLFKNIKVGEVDKIQLSADGESVIVTAYLFGKFRKLLKTNSYFWIVNDVNMQLKNSSLLINSASVSTILNGAISFTNIKLDDIKTKKSHFQLFANYQSLEAYISKKQPGLRILLYAPQAYSLNSGDPVYYRQIQVGHIEWSRLAINGRNVIIKLFIEPTYTHLLRKNSKFWYVGAVETQISLSGIKVKTSSFESLLKGGVSFATPEKKRGRKVKSGDTFYLYRQPDKTWLEWAPKL